MVRISINGFGRIGRIPLRTIIENYRDRVRVSAINTPGPMDTAGWADVLKYYTVYGRVCHEVSVLPPKMAAEIGRIRVDEEEYPVLAIKEPARIPWVIMGWKQFWNALVFFATGKQKGTLKSQKSKVKSQKFTEIDLESLTPGEQKKLIPQLRKAMRQTAADLDFETAAKIIDLILTIKS